MITCLFEITNDTIFNAVLSSIVPAKLIDTPFIYCFLLITHCDFQSAWFLCVIVCTLRSQLPQTFSSCSGLSSSEDNATSIRLNSQ